MKKGTLADRIAEEIINYILENQLKEGDRLPNEATLASQMQVGRSSLREAMKILESRNIVTIRQGAGMYVADDTGVAEDPLGLVPIIHSSIGMCIRVTKWAGDHDTVIAHRKIAAAIADKDPLGEQRSPNGITQRFLILFLS